MWFLLVDMSCQDRLKSAQENLKITPEARASEGLTKMVAQLGEQASAALRTQPYAHKIDGRFPSGLVACEVRDGAAWPGDVAVGVPAVTAWRVWPWLEQRGMIASNTLSYAVP